MPPSPSPADNPSYTLVTSNNKLAQFISLGESFEEIALDTEFKAGSTYRPVLGLIQAALGGAVYLIDPQTCDVTLLTRLFASPAQFIFHAAFSDLEILNSSVGRLPKNIFDTQIAASLLGYESVSLAYLVEDILGHYMDKTSRMIDWTKRPVPQHALAYAATDVAYLAELKNILLARLSSKDMLSWLNEDHVSMLAAVTTPTPRDAWSKIKGARALSGPQRAALRDLTDWRTQQAILRDIPVPHVCDDSTLLKLAKRRPIDPAKISSIAPGLSRELVTALTTLLANPRPEIPVPPASGPPKELEPLIGFLQSAISAFADDISVSPSALATKSDLTAFVLGQPSRLGTGWRNQVVVPILVQLINGERSLRVVPSSKRLTISHLADITGS